jgi:hypothetical protein
LIKHIFFTYVTVAFSERYGRTSSKGASSESVVGGGTYKGAVNVFVFLLFYLWELLFIPRPEPFT